MIAGPNGSGKSSATGKYKSDSPDFPSIYINADNIKKQFYLTDKQAQGKADEMRQTALSRGESFAFETVMSHLSKIDVLREAKEKGYETRTLYITTQDPQINKIRVQQRVADGGHTVPEEKIEPRYDRSMAFMPLALLYSDKAKVFNNSFDNPVLIYEKNHDQEKKYPQLPPSKWSLEMITKHTRMSKEAMADYQRHIQQEQQKKTQGPER
jgi:predicted ABC-type ATPase